MRNNDLTTNTLRPLCWVIIACLILVCHEAHALPACTVQKVLNANGYSFVLCKQGSSKIWLAAPEKRLKVGEEVTYGGEPPMTDFYSVPLKRTFKSIIFTPQIYRKGETPEPVQPADEMKRDALPCDVENYEFEQFYNVVHNKREKKLLVFRGAGGAHHSSFIILLGDKTSCDTVIEEDGSDVEFIPSGNKKKFPEISVSGEGDVGGLFRWNGKKYVKQ